MREPTWSRDRDPMACATWHGQRTAEQCAATINQLCPHPDERPVTAADVQARADLIWRLATIKH